MAFILPLIYTISSTKPISLLYYISSTLCKVVFWYSIYAEGRFLNRGLPPPPLVDHLITEGSATSAEEGKATEKRRERLRLLPYSDWELWRTRFYEWQRAWVTRMNSKAEKLSAQAERKMRTVSAASASKVTSPHSEAAANGSPHSTSLSLPSSYSPGTVVEVSLLTDK